MGVFYATTIGLWASVTTPAPYVSCIGQAACRDFDKGNAMGFWHCIIRRLLPCQWCFTVVMWLRKTPMRPCVKLPLHFSCCHAVCWISLWNFWGKSWNNVRWRWKLPWEDLISKEKILFCLHLSLFEIIADKMQYFSLSPTITQSWWLDINVAKSLEDLTSWRALKKFVLDFYLLRGYQTHLIL